jgi:hypothetical protein
MDYAMRYALCALPFWWHKKCLLLSQRSISDIVDAILQGVGVILKDILPDKNLFSKERDFLFFQKEKTNPSC